MIKTILVNKENKIKNNYLNKITLTKTLNILNEEILIEKEAFEAFIELQKFLKNKNIIIGIDSAYRSLEEQEKVYLDYIKLYGKDYADKFVAPVGYSEHHTALAIDFSLYLNDHYLIDNNEVMENVSLYEEIHKNLAPFGFILRYKKGKENITKYPYEPWHIRYVGKFIAPLIEKNDWVLEEYLTSFSGIIPLYKEKGMTSFDAVQAISQLFGIKKVGHTGTLDPLAEGVLLICIGKATKIVELLTANEKEYIAKVKLGIKTDTLDITGKVIAEEIIPENLDIKKALDYFHKTYLQEVPIYSAVKVNGKKLYEYARTNKKVDLPKKEVTIKKIELLQKEKETFTFKALVSKGCYIRSLINDICQYLNTCGTMTSLIRTKQGNIELNKCYKLKAIKNNKYQLLSIEDVLDFPIVTVNKEISFKIKNGQTLNNNWNIFNKVIFKDENGYLLGIYELKNEKLSVWKNF